MKDLIQKGLGSLETLKQKTEAELRQKLGLIKENIHGLPLFASIEKHDVTLQQTFDEKHYFVIPFYLSEHKFALHTMRCLPEGIPEVNDLPKRRVFHFPSESHEAILRTYLSESAKTSAEAHGAGKTSSLESLANDIDALDKKLTYGMLLVGGAAAIFNPVIGAGIAAKALLPGVASLLNKYGLRPVGEKLTQKQIEKAVKDAEELVAKEFEAASTLKIINPILENLNFALKTDEEEFDPLLDSDYANLKIPELENQAWREFTETAIFHTYKDVVGDKSKHQAAKLGPEDIRWLKIIFELHKKHKRANT